MHTEGGREQCLTCHDCFTGRSAPLTMMGDREGERMGQEEGEWMFDDTHAWHLGGVGVLLSNWTRGPWFFIRDILKESNFWVGSCSPHCLYAKSVPTPTQRHGWIGEWLRCCAFLLLLYSSVLDVWCGLFFTQLVYLFNHKKADLTILSFPNLEIIGLDLFPASFCFHFRKLILLEVSRERRSSLLYICMHACMLVR